MDGKHPPLDTDDEIDLWLLRNVVVASCPRNTAQADVLAFLFKVFLHVRISTLEGDLALLSSSLCEQVVSTALIALPWKPQGCQQRIETRRSVPKDG